MKKNIVCGLMMSVSMFSITAYAGADDNALTTKKYVNDGLEFVYRVANGVENGTVKTLQEAVGRVADPANNVEGAGLLGDVADLQQSVATLQNNSKTYTGGNGITVTPGANSGDPSTIGIALPNGATDGAKYVFQSDGAGGGTWTKIEVADSWSSNFLTGGM